MYLITENERVTLLTIQNINYDSQRICI